MAEQTPEGTRALPIEWQIPTDLVSHYATHIVVQRTEQEFTISFFEVRQPLLIGPPEQRQAELENIHSVPAICVARIVISPARMPEFAKVMSDNLWQSQPQSQETE
jgi:hypothetical protein